ncbi:MAG: TIGR03936 family radical SAM-associated protein, partial [Thermodesulfobacteriota bacterium]|nr:TIGR03936 family radical SAM-associated protein [Thermodesulfobacteriota bacterium]
MITQGDLQDIQRPARYLGGEINQVIKDRQEVRLRFALAFPDVYEIGMSHSGIKVLYHILNSMKGVWAQRVFAPWHDMAEMLQDRDIPLFSLEERRPLGEFDLLGFSLLYELSYTTVLKMLSLARIPLLSEERRDSDPIIVAGGTCTANPYPFFGFFDCVAIGDGEEIVKEIAQVCLETPDRKERLHAISSIDGILIKGQEKRPVRRILTDLDAYPFPSDIVVPNTSIVHDRFGVEVARGCTRGCRFCQAGMTYRPYRERSLDSVRNTFERAIRETGYDDISMLALSVTDLSYINALMENLYCPSREVSLGVPSMRVEGISEKLADIIASTKKTGFTMAPEAATSRLRRVINKGNTEEDLLKSVDMVMKFGWKALKLYFMTGLPGETFEDVDAIRVLANTLARRFRGRITVSISGFVPKPFTPFQWERQITFEEQDEKLSYLKKKIRNRHTSLKWQDPRLTFLEGVFSRGDERLSEVIMGAFQRGAWLDGWGESFDKKAWADAFDASGISPETYLEARDIDAPLVWEGIDMRIDKAFLLAERSRAFEEKETPDCREAGCTGCGVCDSDINNVIKGGSKAEPLFVPREEGVSISYVIGFAKKDAYRLIGSRDFTQMMTRAIRRAGLPGMYSIGYSPRMKLKFLPPLPFGIASDDEYMECLMRENIPPKKVLDWLGEQMPPGVEIFSCTKGKMGQVESYCFQFSRPVKLSIPQDACITKGKNALRVWDYLEAEPGEAPDAMTRTGMKIHIIKGRSLSPLLILDAFSSDPVGPEGITKIKTQWEKTRFG